MKSLPEQLAEARAENAKLIVRVAAAEDRADSLCDDWMGAKLEIQRLQRVERRYLALTKKLVGTIYDRPKRARVRDRAAGQADRP